jgi:ABC-type uncharacterized transport system substrate-binding protein
LATSTIPITFVVVSDPVGAGFVNSLPRPDGTSRAINIEAAMDGKWAELLRTIAPDLSRWRSHSTQTPHLGVDYFS